MKIILSTTFILFSIISASLAQTITTAQSGPWNDTNTWSGGIIPTNVNSSEIRLNHDVNIPSGYTALVDEVIVSALINLTIDNGGTLDLQNSGGTDLMLEEDFTIFFTGSNLIVNGVFKNNSLTALDLGAGLSSVSFNSGSKYNHAVNGLTIPSSGVTWDPNSTLIISGVTSTVPTGLGQNFGNFIFNSPAMTGSKLLGLTATTINGNLEILNTNSPGVVTLASSGGNLNIGGDFIVSGPSRFIALSAPATLNIEVGGDFNFSSTGLLSLLSINNASTTVNLRLNGDFIISQGVLQAYAVSGPDVNIIFKGGTTQNFLLNDGSLLSSQKYDYSVTSSSVLLAADSRFVGTGSFSLNSGCQLSTSRINTINSLGTGAVQVSGTKTFSPGSTIGFSGSNNQVIDPANGFPITSNLIIDKLGGEVSLASDYTLSTGRTLTLTNGVLNIGGGNTLTLNGTVSTTSGGLSGGSLSNLEIGGTAAFGTLGFIGTNELNDFTINRTSSGSVTLGNDLTVLGTFTQTAGDLILNGNEFIINGDFVQSGGSLTSNSASSLTVNGAGTLPTILSLSGDVQRITLDRASATLDLGTSTFSTQSVELFSGILDGGSLTINDGGSIERRETGSLTSIPAAAGTYDLTYNIASAINSGPELTTNIANLTKLGTAVLTAQNDFTVNGDLTLSNGSFDFGSNTVSLNGDFVANAASTLTNATITFDGVTNLSGAQTPTFGAITVNNTFNPTSSLNVNGNITNNGTLNSSGGTLTINAASQLGGTNPINVNNFTIGASGVVTASSIAALEIDGSFTNNGTFDANGGTVAFGGTTTIAGTVPDFHSIRIDGVLNAPSTLVINGNFTNNNTFNNNNGTVFFSGAGTKNIAGSATSSFYDLELTEGSLNVNSNADIHSLLTLGVSTSLDADGSGSGVLTFKSTETLDGSLAALPSGASISGEVTVERRLYTLRNVNQGYHMMGFPLTNVSIAEIQADGFSITGTFSGASTGTTGDGFASIFAYDETAGTTFADGYAAFPGGGSNTSTFTPGAGYYVFSYVGDAPLTLDGRGTLLTGTQTFPLSYSNDGLATDNGWHMVANPYASAVSWGNVTKTNLGSSNIAYVWNPSGGAYETLIDNGASQIRQGQAVFVQAATGGGSVTFEEADKVNSSSAIFYREAAPENEYYMISLFNGTYEDKAYIIYKDEATDAYELKYDAARLINSYETFSLLSTDGEKLKINALAKSSVSECTRSTFFSLEQMVKNRNYELRLGGLANDSSNSYELVDHFLDRTIQISGEFTYPFTVTNNAASKGSSRFELIINKKSPLAVNVETSSACEGNTAYINFSNTQAGISYMLVSQDSVYGQFVGKEDSPNMEFLIEGLNAGDNDFSIKAFSANCDTVLLNNINLVITPTIDKNIEVLGSEICPSESTASFSISSQKDVLYYVLQANDTLKSLKGDGSILWNSIDAAYLSAGENVFQVVADNGICNAVTLSQTINITVEDLIINESISYFGSSVCSGEQASITINAQNSVSYSFKIGVKEIATLVGDGTEKIVNIPSNYLSQGENNVFIYASFGNCKQFEYSEPAIIKLENVVNTILEVNTQDLCSLQSTEVEIANVQVGNVYRLLSNDVFIGSAVANKEGSLSIAVAKEALEFGLNTFDISITNEVCGTFKSENQANIFVSESLSIGQISDLQVCKGEVVTIDIPIEQEFAKISLFSNGLMVDESTNGSFTIVADSSTKFEVIAYNETNCNSNSQEFTLAVSEIGSIEIIQEEQMLKASIEADSYQWYLNDELIEGETNRVLIANESGSYLVRATNGVCENSSEAIIINLEQILANENPLNTFLKLYPNPIESELKIDLTGYSTKNYKVTIFTTEGKFINSYNFTETISTINLEAYKSGVYLLKLVTEKGVITKRIVKK